MSKGRARLAACSIAIFCCLVSVSVSPPANAGGNASITLTKTVDSATVTPVLSVALKADRATALPGDKIGYTATVANSGAALSLTGGYAAQSTAGVSGTVVSWYDDIEYVDKQTQTWQTLAVAAGAKDGYTPADPGPSGPPLSLKVTGQPASGVAYGDRIVGTTISAGATAKWSYTASVQLTQAQATMLADPARVGGFRNVVHLEMSPRTGPQPYIYRASFTNPLLASGLPAASGVQVTFTLPDGSTTTVGPDTVSGLASVAPGVSVDVPASYLVPVLDPRGDSESEADYLARLGKADGAQLTATARADSAFGPATGASTPVTTTEQVPVLKVKKSGPLAAEAGDKVSYDITATDTGRAGAHKIAVKDVVGNDTSDVDFAANLDPAAEATGHADYAIPAGRDPGDLTDTASATWADGNGNAYGPVSDSFTTTVTPSALQPIATSVVEGRFFAEPTAGTGFVAKPGDTPAFGQAFPNIAFDPPAGVVPHDITGTGPSTRPFRDVTEDVNGNALGAITAQGDGHQAGVGDMTSFDAVFTGTLHVAQPGDVTLKLTYDTDVILGIGGSATRVNGVLESPPASGTTAFEGYPVVAADNRGLSRAQPAGETITVHFPTAGTYPYELDYAERRGNPLSLVMQTVAFTKDTSPISVYVGYADGLRAGGTAFPFPWRGSDNVDFQGCQGNCSFDSGAIRIDNTGTKPVTLDDLSTDFAGCHYAIWPGNLTLQPGRIMMFAQEANGADSGCHPENGTFDTSDLPYAGNCTPSGVIPHINVTIDGTTTTYTDDTQVLNTQGIDPPSCGKGNESQPWTRVGGASVGVDTPLPPATFLRISAAGQTSGDPNGGLAVGNSVGNPQQVAVSAMDAAGKPVADLDVTLLVNGANGTQLHGTTNQDGVLDLSYTGSSAGDDTLEASADVHGLHTVSNQVQVAWALPPGTTPDPSNPGETLPAAPPVVSTGSPADGARITTPVPVRADITPPDGETITSWKVTYQDLDPGPEVTLASGEGAPPGTLATFDPTLLPNDTYVIRVTAVSSGGGIQTTSTSVTVAGNLKLGRYVSTYNDLSAAVDGYTMQVRRTYDSTDKRVGDFGVGWKVELVNFRTAANRSIGAGGWSEYAQRCVYGLCTMGVRSSVPHYVSVTFPDGHQEVFDFTPAGGTNVFDDATAKFTARAGLGTNSTLEPVGDTDLYIPGDGNLYSGISGTGGLYNPSRFKLTTVDGRVLILDVNTGLVSETDRQGRSLTIDANGVHSSAGPSITFQRDPQGRITDITGPVPGQHLGYGYDDVGDLHQVTDPNGNVVTYTYDQHRLTSAAGPNAPPFATLAYYPDGRLESTTDAAGDTTTVIDDVTGRQQTVTDPNGKLTTVYTYDDLGDLLRQDQHFDSRTLTTTYTYDPVGRPTSVTDPLGHTWSATYDDAGNTHTVTDPDGRRWRYEYNSLQQPTDIYGPPVHAGDPETLQAHLTYDRGQLVDLEQADHSHTTYTYVGAKLASTTDPGGRTLSYSYDDAGRLSGITDAAQNSVTWVNDEAGRITSVTDQLGNTTAYGYDGDGFLRSVSDAKGHVTQYQYDDRDRLAKAIDPLHNTTQFHYDADSRLARVDNPDGTAIDYGYDQDGRIASTTARPSGETTSYHYDSVGRLVDARNAAADVTLGWNDAGELLNARTTGLGEAAGLEDSLDYTYSDAGLRTSVTAKDGSTHYRYDGLGRLDGVQDPQGAWFTFAYDDLSRLRALTRPNGVDDALVMNSSGDLVSRDASKGGATVAQAEYTIDPRTGLRTALTDMDGQHLYGYDPAGRLTSATHPTASGLADETYGYDAAGNRSSWAGNPSSAVHVNEANQLTADAGNDYAWSPNGDLAATTARTSGDVTRYDSNPYHQLTAVHLPSGAVVRYSYDPFGRRVQRNYEGRVTRYAFDGPVVHSDLDASNNVLTAYTTTGSTDAPLEMSPVSGGKIYPLVDGLGSVTTLTDAAGSAVGRYRYGAYGKPSSLNPTESRFTFTGQGYDPAAGLYDYRARDYNPETGSFISPDPLPADNPYPYADNSPTNLVDPNGLEALPEDGEIDAAEASGEQAAEKVGCGAAQEAQLTADELRAQARDLWETTTGRRAIWDGLQVHHVVPLEWRAIFSGDVNGLSNLSGMLPEDHAGITEAWRQWKVGLGGRLPTEDELLAQRDSLNRIYGPLMRPPC